MAETLRDFAISRYRRANIAERCLRLQDNFDADVNLLLAAAWLAERGYSWRALDVPVLIAHCREWREQCLLPLRAVRCYLKGHALYERAKALELDAEFHQLGLLEQALAQQSPVGGRERLSALKANLQTYADCMQTPAPLDLQCELNGFIDALTQPVDKELP